MCGFSTLKGKVQSTRKSIDSFEQSVVRVLPEIKCVLEVIKPHDLAQEGMVDSSLISPHGWDDVEVINSVFEEIGNGPLDLVDRSNLAVVRQQGTNGQAPVSSSSFDVTPQCIVP